VRSLRQLAWEEEHSEHHHEVEETQMSNEGGDGIGWGVEVGGPWAEVQRWRSWWFEVEESVAEPVAQVVESEQSLLLAFQILEVEVIYASECECE